MAIAIDTPSTGIQRGRGGFMRGANDVPYIVNPERTTVEKGTKAELLALCAERGITPPDKATNAALQELLGPRSVREPYSSMSNFGTLVENMTGLAKYDQRHIVNGIGVAPHLAAKCADLATLALDDRSRTSIADGIVVEALRASNAWLAADRGTHVHSIVEHISLGKDWAHLHDDGTALGIPVALQVAIGEAWRALLADNAIEVLAVEQPCVHDGWRCAGTMDAIVRANRNLRFRLTTGEVVVPAGEVMAGDAKTGSLRRVHAIQIAGYAGSVPYDTEAETRGEWPWPISQEHGLIFALNLADALNGAAPEWHLVYVDLRAGREHGGECVVMAKQWEARSDLFSVAMLPDETAVSAPTPPDAPATTAAGPAEPTTAAEPHTGADTAPTASERADDPAPADAPGDVTTGEVAPPASPVVATPQQQVEAVRARPADEGVAVDDPTFDVLQRAYQALAAEGRAWIASLTEQATRGLVPFHARGHRTARRFEIVRALVLLAQRGDHDDETVRGLLEPIIGDCAQFPSVPVGHLVGSLSATEAAQFSGLVDGRYSISCDDRTGKPVLAPVA